MNVPLSSELSEQVHAEVVRGNDASFPRGRAISLVPTSHLRDAVPLLREVLENDAEEPKYRRLATISLCRLNSAEAREALLSAARTVKEPGVLGGLVHALGQVGDERALRILEFLQAQTEGFLAEQASYAAAQVSQRLGRSA